MTTATKLNGQADEKITALYCRLSVDDDNKDEESNSITNQKQILQDYARKEGYTNTMFFVDDGVSGTTFQRPNGQADAGSVSVAGHPLYRHTGASRYPDRRRRGNDALSQYFQRVVCGADL